MKDFTAPEVNGWPKLRDSLRGKLLTSFRCCNNFTYNPSSDPDISVRRKAVFIMGTLLASSHVSHLPRPSQNNIADNSISPSSNATPHNITPESSAPADPIHPNSHAANLKDPYRIATSELTLDAMREHRIAEYVVNSIVNPLPHGEDGEFSEADLDYEEKAMRLVQTYVVTCSAELSNEQKNALLGYLRDSQRKHDMPHLLDKLGLSSEEFNALTERLGQ